MPRRFLSLTAASGVLLTLLAGAAVAADHATAHPGIWTRVLSYVMEQQGLFHQQLRNELTALGRESSLATAWALIASSFFYGVFHAAGPGHGKVVLTAYLVSHDRRIGRAMVLSTAAAFCQGLVAIALVFGLIWLAGFAGRETQDAALWAERASFALIAALGFYLVARTVRAFLRGHGHGHVHHDHDGHSHEGHAHDGCGHAHVVSPEAARSVRDLSTALAVVVSVGLRPCSGAVLVLAVANILNLAWAGALAVLAISAGTAITVCALALLAVYASDRAVRLVGMRGRALTLSARIVALLGGAVILAAGLSLLFASFGTAHPLGFGAAY